MSVPARLSRALLVALAISVGAVAPASEAWAGPSAEAAETLKKGKKKKGKKNKKGKKKKGKKNKVGNIEKTGLKSVDDFFGEANDIDRRLDRAVKTRRKGRSGVVHAMGAGEDFTFKQAVKELQVKSKNNLKLTISGAGVPQLTPKSALPNDVAAGIDAVNLAMESYVSTLSDLKGVPAAATKLVKKSKKMPDKLKAEFGTFNPAKLPAQIKAVKTLKNNLQVTTSLPGRTKDVVKSLNGDLKFMVEAFGGTWPPKLPGGG